MTTDKVTIKYKNKEYEIEKKSEEQKVKPKGGKETDKEITVKDYKEGKWNHTCHCSENGTDFEKVEIKWGKGKHITIWGTTSLILLSIAGLASWYFWFRNQTKEDEKQK